MDEVLSGTASVEQANHAGENEKGRTNALANAASAYLRSAMHQPVDWMEWGEAAFERAAKEDKPVLLDIGAVWCHWCHVIDRESYEDPETARVINENFVAIKVDRDERPDVDTRYQAAVSAISGQGGWPLTAFLTPDGKPYYGGTYFPPEDRHGRPSFQRVLLTMADAFTSRRTEVDESAASVMNAIEHNESFSGRSANLSPELVEKMALGALKSADLRHGGFGSQPKFPHSGAIDLLIEVAGRDSATVVKMGGAGTAPLPEAARKVAEVTLEKMAMGGIYDHLAGGFHRYSVDEHWIVPHFEKMAYDNSELLKNYVHAYQAFGNEDSAAVAKDILRWMDEWLSDRERGGFYASQDADFSLDDDGDYFTWTRDEAAEVLTAEELSIVAPYYDIGEIGDMHHNVRKNVLHAKQPLSAVAKSAGVSEEQARALLARAEKKLYAARLQRPTPYVDKTMYVAWNAMCISAYLEAARVLGLDATRDFALRSLDRVLAEAWTDGTGLGHVVSYGESSGPAARVAGVLDDYVFLGHATLDAWQATGERRYYDAAERLAKTAVERFYDEEGDAFFDTERPAEGERRLGALATRRKPLQDSPTPAGNPMAAALLMRLSELNGRLDYAEKAQETLETFAGVVEHFGLYAATYALVLERLVREPVQICVIGTDTVARELEQTALKGFAVNKSVVRFEKIEAGQLPPVLDMTLPRLPRIEGSFAVVCSHQTCQPPVTSAAELETLLTRSV
ncbi:MAG TPA: thioredoxin domain-containing protein [Acidobacteriaceae bacterium]|nr:thioredoxin domain-containing protein [Acidobacteriaceae bacterium]